MRAFNPHPVCRVVQVDTRDILFVVGGAFVHLEKLLMDSRHKSSIGFGNKVRLAAGLAAAFQFKLSSGLLLLGMCWQSAGLANSYADSLAVCLPPSFRSDNIQVAPALLWTQLLNEFGHTH